MTDEFYMRRATLNLQKDVDGQIKPDGWCRDRKEWKRAPGKGVSRKK